MTDAPAPPPGAPAAPPGRPRRLLLGVCGGIAAYKAASLARAFVTRGWEVRVVMTARATAFIAPLTFQALTGQPARVDLLDPAHEAAMGHIELARWPDAVLVAPASADAMARLAHGLADDLLCTLCLATDRPLFVAPAMNRLMWAHPATVANTATLRARGVGILGPGAGAQACGETGDGRMLEPDELYARVAAWFDASAGGQPPPGVPAPRPGPLAGRRALVTAGPTREALDPVRFLTNRSSGRQGFAVAEALRDAGAAVTLVCGPVSLPTPAGVARLDVESAVDMLAACRTVCAAGVDILVATAAVADYRAARVAEQKLKKSPAGGETLTLELVRNPDVLATLKAEFPGLFAVGFAAETADVAAYAQQKLAAKNLQMIAANQVGARLAFDAPDNTLDVFWPARDEVAAAPATPPGHARLGPASKQAVARDLVALIAGHWSRR